MKLAVATDVDLPAVVELMNDGFRGSGSQANWNTEAGYIDGDRTSLTLLRDEIAAKPEARLLVGRSEHDGAIVASVWLESAREGVWYLGSLTIAPRLQNAGEGRRLLEAAEHQARAWGATTIRMKVVNVRDTLIAWYLRRGYALTGEVEAFPYDDHRFGIPRRGDLTFMVLAKTL